MSAETKGILRKGTTINQIKEAISKKYADFSNYPIEVSKQSESARIYFNDGAYKRQLFISFANDCEREYGISGIMLILGCWGNSVEIIKYLCETFGGYIDENDLDGEGFYPVNYELYAQELTKMDEFRFKVLKEVGYEKLDVVMNLLEEYKTLTTND
jgi:hypothetical protein